LVLMWFFDSVNVTRKMYSVYCSCSVQDYFSIPVLDVGISLYPVVHSEKDPRVGHRLLAVVAVVQE
jgi:hypothetical protein